MFCKTCHKQISNKEKEVMIKFKFENCIDCRKKIALQKNIHPQYVRR